MSDGILYAAAFYLCLAASVEPLFKVAEAYMHRQDHMAMKCGGAYHLRVSQDRECVEWLEAKTPTEEGGS